MADNKKSEAARAGEAQAIAFGFDRQTDELSLHLFLQRFTDKKVLEVLLPRLQDKEILATVDYLSRLMHNHLSEEEYHKLFLAE